VPHAATATIATAFKICTVLATEKMGLLNRLPTKVSFSIFD
jgi:hypothetical protein